MRSPISLAAAATLLLGACSYDFKNPAEQLDSGEVTGRVVADAGSGLAGVSGVDVRLRNSSASVGQITRDNGRFFLLGLMPGRHTVLFTKAGASGGWAATRDVEVTWGSDGQPEGVIIGDVQVRYPVTITGTLSVPTVGTFYPTALYAFDDATGIAGTFPSPPDLSGATQTSTFTYAFTGLPVGSHRLRFAVVGLEWDAYWGMFVPTTYLVGPINKDVADAQEGQSIPMNPLTLASTAGTGKLRFQVVKPPSLTGTYGVTVTVTNSSTLAVETCSAYSDGTYECDVAAGAYYVDVVTAPADFTFYDPPRITGIVTGGLTTELGALYVVESATASAANQACLDTSDCYSGETCSGGRCVYNPVGMQPCFTGDFSSECSIAASTCTASGASTPCNSGTGLCGEAPDTTMTCVPLGQPECLWNGSQPVFALCGIN